MGITDDGFRLNTASYSTARVACLAEAGRIRIARQGHITRGCRLPPRRRDRLASRASDGPQVLEKAHAQERDHAFRQEPGFVLATIVHFCYNKNPVRIKHDHFSYGRTRNCVWRADLPRRVPDELPGLDLLYGAFWGISFQQDTWRMLEFSL